MGESQFYIHDGRNGQQTVSKKFMKISGRERPKKNHLEKHVLAGYWKRETHTNITSVFLQNLPTILACVTISK